MFRKRNFAQSSYSVGLLLFSITLVSAAPRRAFEGALTVVLGDDFERGRVDTIHELAVPGESSPYQLELHDYPTLPLRTGQRVRVIATELGGRRLGVSSLTVLAVGPGGGGGNGGGNSGGGKGGGGKGARSSAVLLINLLDAGSVLTAAQAEDMMWGPSNSVQDIYLQDSRGKINFVRDSDGDGNADVYGPYDVAQTGAGSCSYRSWGDAARSLAEAEGVNLNNRDHIIYVITGHNNTGCSWGGLAELGGDECWINFPDEFVFFHELGHNLGLNHAGSDTDNDGALNSTYGDGSCFMGASYRNIFLNAPHNERMGYLTAGGGAIQDVPTEPGIYNYVLAPLAWDESLTTHPQILKLPRRDLGRTYYLSLRDSTLYDLNLPERYQTGVSIHWYNEDSPGTVTGYVDTLTDGESFEDPVNGITVTQNTRAPDGSSVDINIDISSTFDVRTPGLDVRSFSGSFENVVGTSEDSLYAVSLVNNDGEGTPATTWSLTTRGISSPMTVTFDQPAITLGPGESATAVLTVNPNGAADGTYVFWVDAIDDDLLEPRHLAVDDFGRLVVDSVSARPAPPTGLTGSSSTSKGKLYLTLGWTASPSSDVAGYRVFIDEPALPRYWRFTAGAAVYSRWTAEPGLYQFRVAAENSAGKLSALSEPVSVNIQKSGGK